jgi:5-methylcytosine-specific restriction endonuclease McrA
VSEAWARGRNKRQQKIRLQVLDRDRWRCTLRYPGEWTVRVRRRDGSWGFDTRRCLDTADQAHHTADRTVVGDDPRYMVAACGPCNRRAGDPSRRGDPPHRRARTAW